MTSCLLRIRAPVPIDWRLPKNQPATVAGEITSPPELCRTGLPYFPTRKKNPSVALEVSAEPLRWHFDAVVNAVKFFLGAMLHTRPNVTRIKLICKSLIYARGALKFLAQSPNYAGVLDEIVYFFQLSPTRRYCLCANSESIEELPKQAPEGVHMQCSVIDKLKK